MNDFTGPTAATYRFGQGYVLCARSRRLTVHGQDVSLRSREFDLLLALVERAGQPVSKNDLLDRVWAHRVVEETNIKVQVFSLRKLLGPKAIETIPGLGYRFALNVEGSEAQPAPTAVPRQHADAPNAHRAPMRATPLLGREEEVSALAALVQKHRVVTIVGTGGVGKTHLAEVVAAAVSGSFKDGLIWIDLSSLSDPVAIHGAIALVAGLKLGPQAKPLDALLQALAGRVQLLVFDGAEHMREAIASLVAALCASAPELHCLVTSQVRLNLPAEHVFRLGGLGLPEREVSAMEAVGYGAIGLFAARVQALDRRFALTPANVAEVVDLCRRLDGIALAIELAAARVSTLGVQAVAARLAERFRLLTSGSSNAPARHQTLRAAFAWSHSLLSATEQVVFRRLAVFAGSFALEDMTAVVAGEGPDPWTVIDALNTLVERSLVAMSSSEPPRYRLLESARAFALGALEAAGEADVVRRRHLLYCRERAEAARDGYYTDAWPAHRAWLRTRYAELRAALQWALEAESDVPSGAAIVVSLQEYWYEYWQAQEAHTWSSLAYRHLDELPPLDRARLFCLLGNFATGAGDYEEGDLQLGRSIDLAAAIDGGQVVLASACNGLGVTKQFKGAPHEAHRLFERAHAIYRSLGNRRGLASALHNIGLASFGLGDLLHAESQLQEALSLETTSVQGFTGTISLIVLSECAFERGEIELAIDRVQQSIATLRQFDESPLLAQALQRYGRYELAQGRTAVARAALAEALNIMREAEVSRYLVNCIESCNEFALAFGQPDTAARLLGFSDAFRAARSSPRSPFRQRQADDVVRKVQAAMEEGAYAHAVAQGRVLRPEQALHLALSLV